MLNLLTAFCFFKLTPEKPVALENSTGSFVYNGLRLTFFNKQLSAECKNSAQMLQKCLTDGYGSTTDRCHQCNEYYQSFKSDCSQEMAKNIASDVICDMNKDKSCYDHIVAKANPFLTLLPFNCTNSCHKKYALFLRNLRGYTYSNFGYHGWEVKDIKTCIGETCITKVVDYFYCHSSKNECNSCESIRPPCECYPIGNITDILPSKWPDTDEQEDRDYIQLQSQLVSQLSCLKIDGKYCQESLQSNNTYIKPFSCNNICHRNVFKTVFTKYWLMSSNPIHLPLSHKYGWTNETYNTCPLSKTISNCPYTPSKQFNIHVQVN